MVIYTGCLYWAVIGAFGIEWCITTGYHTPMLVALLATIVCAGLTS